MKVRYGRKGRLYYHASSFTGSGLIIVDRTKDITLTDEARDMAASAVDMEYDVHEQGGKEFLVEVEKLIEATDGTSLTALRNSYLNRTDLYFVLCKDVKANASGDAIKWVGRVMTWNESTPEEGAATVRFTIRPTDPDNLPTRISTPVA